ncbi:hypothetical protein F7725_010540 [Dissostichus mawsoni]|uniref:Uncharacterized protein n=1 Tax=Dissostichus mawsoni TaxID=36200 RepID=A0A7J5XNT3_DISMA|nr:hypothetical protein F7725_010540 [Dissostichus mawsoni]
MQKETTHILPVVVLFLHLVVLVEHQFMTHLTVGLQHGLLLISHLLDGAHVAGRPLSDKVLPSFGSPLSLSARPFRRPVSVVATAAGTGRKCGGFVVLGEVSVWPTCFSASVANGTPAAPFLTAASSGSLTVTHLNGLSPPTGEVAVLQLLRAPSSLSFFFLRRGVGTYPLWLLLLGRYWLKGMAVRGSLMDVRRVDMSSLRTSGIFLWGGPSDSESLPRPVEGRWEEIYLHS